MLPLRTTQHFMNALVLPSYHVRVVATAALRRQYNLRATASFGTTTSYSSRMSQNGIDPSSTISTKLSSLTFDHPSDAFSCLSTVELAKHAALLSMLRIRPLSENAALLMDVSKRLIGKPLTNFFIQHTLFNHFCGGEDLGGLIQTSKILARRNIGSILDYAAECEDSAADSSEGPSDAWLDSNVELTKDAISSATHLRVGDPSKSFSFVAVKFTSVCNPALLRKVTTCLNFSHFLYSFAAGVTPALRDFCLATPLNHDVLMNMPVRRDQALRAFRSVWPSLNEAQASALFDEMATAAPSSSTSGDGMNDTVSYFQWTTYFSPEKLSALPTPVLADHPVETANLASAWLTQDDLRHWRKTEARIDDFCQLAAQKEIRLLVDAEQTFYQTAIDYLAWRAMSLFSPLKAQLGSGRSPEGVPAIIYNTYQLYLKNGKGRLACDAARADTLGYKFATKLVRGAYMYQEARVASEHGYPSPVHNTIEDTHLSYDSGVEFMMSRVPRSELLCGTHNESSVSKAARLLAQISPHDPQAVPVSFAQLLGMCDHISLQLGQSGVRTFKYVPYGPLDLVLPYLIRRAEENSSILSGSVKETRLMWSEIWNRMMRRVGIGNGQLPAGSTAVWVNH